MLCGIVAYLSFSAHSEQDKHEQLCTLISETPIFSILTVGDTDCEELYRNYLYDFVRIVHQCHHTEATMEYEVILCNAKKEREYYKLFVQHYIEHSTSSLHVQVKFESQFHNMEMLSFCTVDQQCSTQHDCSQP